MNNTTITHDDYARFVAGLFFRNPGDLSKDFAHAVMGILEELEELAVAHEPANVIEEMGDLLFFCRAAEMVLTEHLGNIDVGGDRGEEERPMQSISAPAFVDRWKQADEALTRMLGRAKKWVGYGDAPTSAVARALLLDVETVASVVTEQTAEDLDMEQDEVSERAIEANVAKLRHRYKAGFSLEASRHRDLEGERHILEEASAPYVSD